MKTRISFPPIVPPSTNNEQNLAPQQLWQHLNKEQQQAVLRSMTQICWQIMQSTPQQEEVAHANQ